MATEHDKLQQAVKKHGNNIQHYKAAQTPAIFLILPVFRQISRHQPLLPLTATSLRRETPNIVSLWNPFLKSAPLHWHWKMSARKKCITRLVPIQLAYRLTRLLLWNCIRVSRCHHWSMPALCLLSTLVNARDRENRWSRILHMQQQLTGAPVALSDEVNQSEQTTNFHNRAIAWLLYSANTLYCDPMEACDVYTRQCSTLINTIELATIGATLLPEESIP